jgi:hypothetical protein
MTPSRCVRDSHDIVRRSVALVERRVYFREMMTGRRFRNNRGSRLARHRFRFRTRFALGFRSSTRAININYDDALSVPWQLPTLMLML